MPVLDRWAAGGIAACALGFALFYGLLFRRDNAAPSVDVADVPLGQAGVFFHATTFCRMTPDRVIVRGWAVRKGVGWPLTRNRVVMRLANGRTVALDTAMLDSTRKMLAGTIHALTQDQRTYYAANFAASLNLKAAGVGTRDARLFLDWHEPSLRALLPLDCPRAER
ncbi:hypothetical protein [Pseudoxanthomonas sp.]|uniref:hypothetical protein n=1 Tax=Pseudoxanthomonas sp. TaxID=1871049 RepID=UPI002617CA6F|nr:hypothetical protein [Pseudoxanthomonas sp.]WDS35825.1 MAG: hypothetical protein O8I58_16125 [Pseudoxanthomonas sp.]